MNQTYIFILSILLLLSYSTEAQTINELTEDRAINMAIENNKNVKASLLDIASAESLKKTAIELPKTNLTAQLGQYNSDHFDHAFQLSQTIPFPTIFGARKNLINAQITSQKNLASLTILELKKQVRTYYYQIQYLENNSKKLQYLDSLYGSFVSIATTRYNAGDTKKVDISTAKAKKGQILLLLQQNQVYLKAAYKNLSTLTGIELPFEVVKLENYRPLKVSQLLDTANLVDHPSVKAFYNEALIAERNIQVEKANGLPDLTIGYTNQSLVGTQTINNQDQYFGSGHRFSYANIGIAIPLTFGATKARMKSLQLTQKAAEESATQKKAELKAQLSNAWLQYQQDLKQYEYYQEQAIPNAQAIIEAAQVGYKTGDMGYVEYVFALQTATDIQLNFLNSIQQVNQSVVNIYSLINR